MKEPNCPLQWYTRRGGVIRGPFGENEITRHFLLGRIRQDDELSQDRMAWTLANDCTELLPSELKKLSSWDDYQQLVIARMQVDERNGERRCQQCSNYSSCHPERRSAQDRRSKNDDHLVSQYLFGHMDTSTEQNKLRPLLLTMLLATMVLAWLLPTRA